MNLKIIRTSYPDGTARQYLFGMTPPELRNLGYIMKQAALEAAIKLRKIRT